VLLGNVKEDYCELCILLHAWLLQYRTLSQLKMARGHQKIQSQQKNAEKQAKMKKAQGSDQKKAAQAALVYVCAVCKACVCMIYILFR